MVTETAMNLVGSDFKHYDDDKNRMTNEPSIDLLSFTPKVDGKLLKPENTSFHAPDQTSEKSKKVSTNPKYIKYVGIFAFLLMVVVVVETITIFSLINGDCKAHHHTNDTNPTKTPISHDGKTTRIQDDDGHDDGDTLRPAGPGAIIEKKQWGGKPTLEWDTPLTLKHPTPFVIIMHTITPQCHNFDECSSRLQSIQSFHISGRASPDIRYNFVIGGDGNAYVGRGWDMKNSGKSDSISIVFIGNYIYDELTPEMINIAQKLLKIGVEKGKLAEDYKLVAHNQTLATESPGKNVYKVIKTWPHFNPMRYI